MKQTTPMKRATPLKRTPFARVGSLAQSSFQRLAKPKSKRLKSTQRPVSAADQIYWSRLAGEIGCIACRIDGNENPFVSIHHIDGRTKPGCHSLALPLCGPHHQQDDTDPAGRIAVHPNKARFEAKYGSQMELKEKCDAILAGRSDLRAAA